MTITSTTARSPYHTLPPLPEGDAACRPTLLSLIKGEQRLRFDADGKIYPRRNYSFEYHTGLPFKAEQLLPALRKAYDTLRTLPPGKEHFVIEMREGYGPGYYYDFFITPASTPSQPRLHGYRSWSGAIPIKTTGSGKIYSAIEINTGRQYVVKKPCHLDDHNPAEDEWQTSQAIGRQLAVIAKGPQSSYPFAAYNKYDGSPATECVAIIKIKNCVDRELYMPQGSPLESNGDRRINFKRCLQFDEAHKLLRQCGYYQVDVKFDNAIIAKSKGGKEALQLIDLHLFFPSDPVKLLQQIKTYHVYYRATYRHPILYEKINACMTLLRYNATANATAKSTKKQLKSLLHLIEQNLCLAKLVVMAQLVHCYAHKRAIIDYCNNAFGHNSAKLGTITDLFAKHFNGERQTLASELQKTLPLPESLASCLLMQKLEAMLADPDNITVLYQEALEYIRQQPR